MPRDLLSSSVRTVISSQPDPNAAITVDLLDAFVLEAKAHEAEILAWADGLIVAGSHTAANALAAGFKAKVPLAGGSIGAAISTALDQIDVKAEAGLKVAFDHLIDLANNRAAELTPSP